MSGSTRGMRMRRKMRWDVKGGRERDSHNVKHDMKRSCLMRRLQQQEQQAVPLP